MIQSVNETNNETQRTQGVKAAYRKAKVRSPVTVFFLYASEVFTLTAHQTMQTLSHYGDLSVGVFCDRLVHSVSMV